MAEKIGLKSTTGNGSHEAVATPAPGKPAGGTARGPGSPPSPPPKRKGGRRREDGLPAGSPEAEEADRAKDRLRKQQERALAEPPPLPSAGSPAVDTPGPSPGPQNPDAGNAASLPDVPWEAKDFRPFIDEWLDGSEKTRMTKREVAARDAGFSEPAVKKFKEDARFPGGPKSTIAGCGSSGLARIANKLRFSRTYGEGGMALIAVLTLIGHNKASDAEFKRTLAEFKKRTEAESKSGQ